MAHPTRVRRSGLRIQPPTESPGGSLHRGSGATSLLPSPAHRRMFRPGRGGRPGRASGLRPLPDDAPPPPAPSNAHTRECRPTSCDDRSDGARALPGFSAACAGPARRWAYGDATDRNHFFRDFTGDLLTLAGHGPRPVVGLSACGSTRKECPGRARAGRDVQSACGTSSGLESGWTGEKHTALRHR